MLVVAAGIRAVAAAEVRWLGAIILLLFPEIVTLFKPAQVILLQALEVQVTLLMMQPYLLVVPFQIIYVAEAIVLEMAAETAEMAPLPSKLMAALAAEVRGDILVMAVEAEAKT